MKKQTFVGLLFPLCLLPSSLSHPEDFTFWLPFLHFPPPKILKFLALSPAVFSVSISLGHTSKLLVECWPLSVLKQSLPACTPSSSPQVVSLLWGFFILCSDPSVLLGFVLSLFCPHALPQRCSAVAMHPKHLQNLCKHSSPFPLLTIWISSYGVGPRHLHFSATAQMVLMCSQPWQPTWACHSHPCLHRHPACLPIFHLDFSLGPEACFLDMSTQGLQTQCVYDCLPAFDQFCSHPNLLLPLCCYLSEWCQTSPNFTSQKCGHCLWIFSLLHPPCLVHCFPHT